jgi:hypothetical protein
MFEQATSKKMILFEWGAPVTIPMMLNYCPGVWKFCLTPGVITFTDDNGNACDYSYNNTDIYQVSSLKVDNTQYQLQTSIADLLTYDESYYYDSTTKYIYISFYNWDKPLDKEMYIGAIYGFSRGLSDCYYNNIYYEPRLLNGITIKKSKDPLFYGLLKFTNAKINLINSDGEYDNFGSMNLFRAYSRLLCGEDGSAYTDLQPAFTGLIGNYAYNHERLTISLDDSRTGLGTTVPINKYTKTAYTYLSDDDVDKYKPVAYGDVYDCPCVCLNGAQTTSVYTFHFMDTSIYNATALTTVYIDGVAVSPTPSPSLSAGTFTLTSSQVDEATRFKVTADFTGANIVNGVEIIKDIMTNYVELDYIAENYDLTEVAAAVTASRDTSFYASKEIKINKALEQICVDIDALFFVKDNGCYTVRIYDSNRASSATILKDDWTNQPEIENNTDEFLSSVTIKYHHKQSSNSYRTYVNTVYEQDVYDMYKSKQGEKEIATNLTSLTDAQAKSETIMAASKQIYDVVKRSVHFDFYGLEIMDFVTCDPYVRISGAETPAIWEVIGIDKNLDSWSIALTLRYIKAA